MAHLMSETAFGHAYNDDDWPHGLRCAQCDRLMQEGDRFSERLDSMIDETPIALIVCVSCALDGEPP